jgi:hypothetical protein
LEFLLRNEVCASKFISKRINQRFFDKCNGGKGFG